MVYFDQHQQSGDSFIGGGAPAQAWPSSSVTTIAFSTAISCIPTKNNQNRGDPCSCFLKSGGCDPNWAREQVTAESSGLPFLPAKQPTALFFSLFGDNSQEFVLRGLSLFEVQRAVFLIPMYVKSGSTNPHPKCFLMPWRPSEKKRRVRKKCPTVPVWQRVGGGWKLFGQCQYTWATFKKGASLSESLSRNQEQF